MNVEQILRNYGVHYTKDSEYLKVICLYHDDSKPSGSINAKGFYKCWVCGVTTNLTRYLAKLTNRTARDIFFELAREGYTDNDNPLDPQDIERDHIRLFGNTVLLEELRKRGVTQEIIQKYRLGVYGDRISIPITNMIGQFVNKRLYLPGATEAKFLNLQGRMRSKIRFTPAEQLDYDKILLCGGELKGYVAAEQLNPHDIGAGSPTCGEDAWDIKLNGHFQNKIVYVCCDIDEAGISGAEKRCRLLNTIAAEVYKIELPLDKVKYPKGDINDFVMEGGQLIDVIKAAKRWELNLKTTFTDDEEPIDVGLEQALNASYAKKKIRLSAVIASLDMAPYSIPKDVEILCPRGQDVCPICPVSISMPVDKQIALIKAESIEIMEMIGQDVKKQEYTLKRAIGIPQTCKVCTFNPITFYHVEDSKIAEPIDFLSRDNSVQKMPTAYFVGEESVQLNEGYELEGRMYPHPQSQQAALLITKYKLLEDALSNYVPDGLDRLNIFKPVDWTYSSLEAKLEEIYWDLAANITDVHRRINMHVAVDLFYHSPLFIHLEGKKQKGWTEILLVGDSGMAKTQLLNNLINHYGLAARIEGKNCTRSGILGGVKETGNKRQFITWGIIPVNDRRGVVIEEIKGMPIELIGKLTDMRSSGIAEVVMIERRKANARTRLLMTSNPRSDRNVGSYGSGIDIIRELVGSPEDIRRFDAIIIVDKREISMDEIHATKPKPGTVPHIFTSQLCRELILYCWTVENIVFEDELYIFEKSKILCSKYSDEIPICDRGTMHLKLARLSAALAGRTFSVENDDTLVVRKCHIEYVFNFLQQCYDTSAFGYDTYSKRILTANKMINTVETLAWITGHTASPEDFIESIALTEEFDISFFQDLCDWGRNQAQTCISYLLRNKAIKKVGRMYRKTSDFTELLKDAKLNKLQVPDKLKEKF